MKSSTFVLFGATGDLAKRKIYPALYNLFLDQQLSKPFSVIGVGRREWSNEAFQQHVKQSIETFSRRTVKDLDALQVFLDSFRYSTLDVENKGDYQNLLNIMK